MDACVWLKSACVKFILPLRRRSTRNHSNMAREHGSDATHITRLIVDVLVPLVIEEILKAAKSISQERIRQGILNVPEADQGQSTFKRQPKRCAGARVVADSEQTDVSMFESQPAKSSASTTHADTVQCLIFRSRLFMFPYRQRQLRSASRSAWSNRSYRRASAADSRRDRGSGDVDPTGTSLTTDC